MYEKTYQEMMDEMRGEDQVEQNAFDSIEKVAEIISKIVMYRIKQGLTQKDIAEKTGMKQSAIARMENLDSMPRFDTVMKVALALGIAIQATTPSERIVLGHRSMERSRDQIAELTLTLGA